MTIGCEKTLPSTQSSTGEDFSGKVLKNSKLLLSGSFTELKANSFAESHLNPVELCLTTSGELLVLKKKPHGHSLVRKHNLKSTIFTQHPQIANAMQAEVPSTVLRYIYQLENPESTVVSISDWIAELQRRNESVLMSSGTHSQLNGECSSHVERPKELANHSPREGVVNGFTHTATNLLSKPKSSYKLTSPTSPVAHKRATFPLENLGSSESDSHFHSKDQDQVVAEVEPPFIHLSAANNNHAEPAAVVVQIVERDNTSGDDDTGGSSSNWGPSKFQDELDVFRMTKNHRGSLRLDFQTARHKILRSASDRLVRDRTLSCTDVQDPDEVTPRKTSVSTSELGNMERATVLNGGMCSPTTSCELNPLTHCPSDKSEFLSSRFRHMQIRNRKWKFSPRFSRSSSYQHTPSDSNVSEEQFSRSISASPASASSSHTSEAPRSVRSSVSEVEPSEVASSSKTSAQSSTLPRVKKGDMKRLHSNGPQGGKTAPGSPMMSNKLASKSPRLLRMFHRRWQSSSAIKVPLNLDDSTMSTDSQPSSFPCDGLTPNHHHSTAPPKKLHQYTSKEVAEELTLIDAELLRSIGPEEVQNEAWMKKDTKEQLAPNVMAMVRAFNQLALLVPSEILEETTPQARAKVITAYIQIASKCYRFRNFNSLKAILAGLQCTPIYRLKSSWKEVSSKKRKRFEQLSTFMSECDNWQMYQDEIERLTSSDTPFIPFLGQFLTKLVHQKSYQQIKAEKRAKESPSSPTASSTTDTKTDNQDLSSSTVNDHPHLPSECKQTSASSSISSSDDENNRDMNAMTPSEDEFHNVTPSVLVRKPSITTSEDSIDSKFNLADYLSHRRFTDQAHSAYVHIPVSPNVVVDGTDQESEDTPGPVYRTTNFLSPVTTPTHRRLEFEELQEDDVIDGESDSGLHSSIDCRSSSIPRSSSQGSFTLEHDHIVELRRDHSNSVNEGLDLSHIYFKLKRRSRSYESLLDAYTDDDPGLKGVLRSTLAELARLSSSLESLDSISDDDFSCDVSSISLDINVHGNHDMSSSFTSNSTYELHETLSMMRTTTERISETIRRVSMENNIMKKEDMLEVVEKTEDLQTSSELLDHEIEADEGDDKKVLEKTKRPVRRSKSYSNSGVKKKFLRRKRYGRHNSTNKSSEENSKEVSVDEPHQALNKYQIASLGCSVGIEAKTVLRSLIRDASPNTEKENYSLSVTREA